MTNGLLTMNLAHPNENASLHGKSGPMTTGYFAHFSNVAAQWLLACGNLGIPIRTDLNRPGETLGVTRMITYIQSDGRRSSSETGYLTTGVLSRPNLKVVGGAQVTKLLVDKDDITGTKRAVGVEFRKFDTGPKYRVRARKEVVLCAGAVHTPHILMLSGIGPSEHLSALAIPLVHDLPGVGSSLRDHNFVNLCLRAKPGRGSLQFLAMPGIGNTIRRLSALSQWLLFGKGPLSTNTGEAAAFVRTSDPQLFPPSRFASRLEDTTSGPDAPDLEIISLPFATKDQDIAGLPSGDLVSLAAILLRPTSVGTVRLRSADPNDAPIIDPNCLDTKHDMDFFVRGIRLMLQMARTEPYASIIDHTETDTSLDHHLDTLTDEQLKQVVRRKVETLYHPTGTAKMAPLAEGGVVDPYLRVHGIPNLRVADASIMPSIVSGHTAGPTIAIGEKAADMIKVFLQ